MSELTNRKRHRAQIRAIKKQIKTIVPNRFSNRFANSCEACGMQEQCRTAIKQGKLFPCQPQDQSAQAFKNHREEGDFIQLLIDRGEKTYHKPSKKEMITQV